jgi:predicted RNase H-like HicB family nuclease
MAFTAVYLKSKHGYVGFIEEVPSITSHGSTIEQARLALGQLARYAFEQARRESGEMLGDREVVREPLSICVRRTAEGE